MKYALSRLKFKALISLIALVCCAHTAVATTVIIPADDDMIVGARAIIRGKVLSVASAYDSQQDRVYTYITIKVQEVIKGNITERKIVLKELGGQAGDHAFILFGSPRFTPGEQTLLYLDTRPDGSLQTHQMFLGKFNIVRDPDTGKRMVVRSSPDKETEILQWQPHDGHTHGPSTEKMELSAYVRMVRERLAANWERSVKFEEQHYSGVPVMSEPSEYDGIVQKGGLEAQFTLLGNFRFFQPDSGQPVPLSVGTAPPGAGIPIVNLNPNDMAAAGGAWSNVSGCSLQLSYTGTFSADCYTNGSPGIFVVWNNCDGRNTPSAGCAGLLAWGGISSTGSQTIVIGGTTFRQTVTGFVSFNPWAACNFGSGCNVAEIATHEIGHALGLGHSADSSATMAAFAHFDGRCASIRTDDANGIRFIYPGSGGGALTITTSTLASGTVSTAYSQTLVASGGTPPYSWSLASGSGPLPTGLTLNSNGTITGTPSVAGTFNFTAQVNDSASGTAQKALSITINPSGGGYNSQFVSQNPPTSVSPGQQFNVTFSWLNNGSQTWNGSAGFRLRSQNPADNTTWGGNQVNLTGSWAVGQTMSVIVTFTAPSTPGTYNFQWQTYQDGVGFFGQPSTNVSIQVGGGGGTDNAAFVTQSVSSSMTAGQIYGVSVTMQNNGTTTWAAGTYQLGSQNPQDNTTWGLNRVSLASSVAPGGSATFTFNVTAPGTAGTYNFQWRMVNGSTFFGASSTNVAVSVTSGGGGGGGPYNAAFVSQVVPSSMTPGQSYSVSVTMRNTGTQSWSSASGITLSSQNPAGNSTWGVSNVVLNKFIASGSQFTFTFTITAPSTPGTYNFQWQLKRAGAYFGQVSTNLPVQVGTSGGGTDNAAFVTQSVPSSMTAGQSVSVSVTMQNNGTTTWAAGTYKLGSQNPQDNMTWGLNRVNLASSVAPGANGVFTFNVTAPGTAGSYNFQWRMVNGTVFFGATSTNVVVTVTSGGGGPVDSAAFVSQSVPSSMTAGQSVSVSVTMQNNGTTTWAAGTYKLGSQNPQDNMTWGLNRVNLASSVAPGANGVFTFNVTAPSTAGTYNFQWKMVNGSTFFGAVSANVSVSVTSGGSAGPPSITTTSLPNGVRNGTYNAQLQATGGTLPYTWTMTGSPAGLTINSSTGKITGSPTVSGIFNVTVTVRDAANQTASRTYKVFIQ